ncbi:hypothetical protein ACQUW5_03010 [Legionella sp. CNM-1927-20]|uniref:hypothetical protein n=1 Tax=Legionella sp. CNM-1927-20 TaxID=3422221 RepID=UPI00403B1E36
MLTKIEIHHLIAVCQLIGKLGLDNGVSAQIPKIHIDILQPPNDFIGVNTNPAIFINKYTYQLLGRLHPNWIVNQTIAVKATLLSQPKLEIIGALIHEVGHAFNVTANIANTEENAYIFEIEVLCKLFASKLAFLDEVSSKDLKTYFESRLPYYKKCIATNNYLTKLVEQISKQFNLSLTHYTLPILQSGNSTLSKLMFFQGKYKLEDEIVVSNLTLS